MCVKHMGFHLQMILYLITKLNDYYNKLINTAAD